MQKKVLAINDISCVGRCSLTVALPIISASGAECSILPTSILSNHTAFPQYTFLDLTNEMKNICEKWKSLNLKYDYLYTGFLGSIEQVDLVGEIVREFKEEITVEYSLYCIMGVVHMGSFPICLVDDNKEIKKAYDYFLDKNINIKVL